MATMNSMKFQNYNTISNNFHSNLRNPLSSEQSENLNLNPNYNQKTYYSTNFTAASAQNYNNTNANQNLLFFSFKPRSGKLRWKEIMKLDFEHMVKTNDISPLEAFLENLIFSSVEENDVEIISENATVKLIKIYQHVLEYLLHTQLRLESENKALELSYAQLQTEASSKENTLRANKSLISSLKKDKREKEQVLNTYKCLMHEYKNSSLSPYAVNNFNSNDKDLNKNNFNLNSLRNSKLTNSALGQSSIDSNFPNNYYNATDKKQYFFCQYCSGKKFSSEENLYNHFQRRHANANSKNKKDPLAKRKQNDLDFSDLRHSKRDYVTNLKNQIEELKNMFQNFMKNCNPNDSLNKLALNQRALESQTIEIQKEKENIENLMQESFKKTLIEIKEFVKNSTNNSNNGKNDSENKKLNNVAGLVTGESFHGVDSEGIEAIKNNITNMNEMIMDMQKNQDEKIHYVYEQIGNIKTAITDELKDLKNFNNAENADNQSKFGNSNKNFNTQSFSENRYNNNLSNNRFRGDSMEITNAYSISNLAADKPESSRANRRSNVPTGKKAKKPIFNAGPLESDYSEEENQKNQNVQIIRRSEATKTPQEKRNDTSSNNPNKNLKELFKFNDDNSAIVEVASEKREITVENIKSKSDETNKNNKNTNNQKHIENAHNISDIASCDVVLDNFSAVTKDKKIVNNKVDDNNKNNKESSLKQKKESKAAQGKNKNQKQEDPEFIMDDVSEDKSKSATKANKEKEQLENSKIKEKEKNPKLNEDKINKKSEDEDSEIQFKRKKTSVLQERTNNEIQITNFKNDLNIENYVMDKENLDEIKTRFVEQFQEREKLFKMANVDLNELDVEKDEFEFYKPVLQKPNGDKKTKFVEGAVESKVNHHMQSITNNEDFNIKNIDSKKPEELISLIDNILDFINLQKDNGNGVNDFDDDDEEESGDFNQLFGKYYYELNKTIFKKINLEDEYSFMIKNINGLNRNTGLNGKFRETLSLPKLNKDGNRNNNKIWEEKVNQHSDSKEELKNLNRDNSDFKDNRSGNMAKYNNEDEFNH